MIDYCEKEYLLMKKLRSESVNGINKKYDWENITNDYCDVFINLINKRNFIC